MSDHPKMYAILCSGISNALDLLPNYPKNKPCRFLLEQALSQAEEVYIQTYQESIMTPEEGDGHSSEYSSQTSH